MSSLSYKDVYLVPKYSELRSRSEADVSVEFLGRKFKAPWLPANMESVINEVQAKWLSENDYFYIYHRFGDTLDFVTKANVQKWKTISISIGVKKEDEDLLVDIIRANFRVDFITIDVAHGHSILVKEMIDTIRSMYLLLAPNVTARHAVLPKIIAGNVATPEAVRDLTNWGADAVKVGIAGGAACSTKHQTGFHVPMFSCVENCYQNGNSRKSWENGFPFRDYNAEIPIIADGGVRENGDIPKALVAGATMVMAGGLFAACVDAAGENVYKEFEHSIRKRKEFFDWYYSSNPNKINMNMPREEYDKTYILKKRYHGSASAKQKGEHKHVEGFEIEIPCNGLTYESKYQELTESLKSAVSYAGGKDLSAFKSVEYIIIK